jgi:hypothetical protein
MEPKAIAYFLGAMLVGALAAGADPANAADVRQHASACSPTNAGMTYSHGANGLTRTGGGVGEFFCPHNSLSSGVTHTAANGLNLHMFQPNSGAASGAKACVTFWASNGGSCGTQVVSLATGDVTLSPSRSVWNASGNAGDFPYVHLTLGPQASLRGYWVSN